MKRIKRFVFLYLLMGIMLFTHIVKACGMDSEGNVVVVLDPGHGGLAGGADDGADYNGVTERFINLTVANAAKQELEKYNKVKVYLTRTSPDVSMTLRERAEFAESVQADFVFSIHFNASEYHNKYGAEVWIPSIGKYYTQGYQFADISVKELEQMGLYNRGIKTRVGDGEDEYYGIIRECEHRGIPAVIIEHCYVDNMHDYAYFDEEQDLEAFGKADGEAIAKYFRLQSSEKDYRDYALAQVEEPDTRVYQDTSAPDLCEITLNREETKKGTLSFNILGKDKDSKILYYDYSLDGGATYSDLYEWQDTDADNRLTVLVSNVDVEKGTLVVRVYNQYDISAEGNRVEFSMLSSNDNHDNLHATGETKQEKEERPPDTAVEKVMIAVLLVAGGIAVTILLIKRHRI